MSWLNVAAAQIADVMSSAAELGSPRAWAFVFLRLDAYCATNSLDPRLGHGPRALRWRNPCSPGTRQAKRLRERGAHTITHHHARRARPAPIIQRGSKSLTAGAGTVTAVPAAIAYVRRASPSSGAGPKSCMRLLLAGETVVGMNSVLKRPARK